MTTTASSLATAVVSAQSASQLTSPDAVSLEPATAAQPDALVTTTAALAASQLTNAVASQPSGRRETLLTDSVASSVANSIDAPVVYATSLKDDPACSPDSAATAATGIAAGTASTAAIAGAAFTAAPVLTAEGPAFVSNDAPAALPVVAESTKGFAEFASALPNVSAIASEALKAAVGRALGTASPAAGSQPVADALMADNFPSSTPASLAVPVASVEVSATALGTVSAAAGPQLVAEALTAESSANSTPSSTGMAAASSEKFATASTPMSATEGAGCVADTLLAASATVSSAVTKGAGVSQAEATAGSLKDGKAQKTKVLNATDADVGYSACVQVIA